jgi:hypothetical protein
VTRRKRARGPEPEAPEVPESIFDPPPEPEPEQPGPEQRGAESDSAEERARRTREYYGEGS